MARSVCFSDMVLSSPEPERSMFAPSRSNRVLLATLALTLIAGPAIAQTPAGAPMSSLPDTPVGRVVTEWLTVFNAADSIKLAEYYRKYRLDRNLSAQLNRARQSGGFDVVSIEKS